MNFTDTQIIFQSPEHSVAWAAGLFEGEGSVFVWSSDETHRYLRVTLGMTDEDVVRRFAEVVGAGKVRGPYASKRENNKPMFHWEVNSRPVAESVIAMLWPYLGSRRRAKIKEVFDAVPEVTFRSTGLGDRPTCRLCLQRPVELGGNRRHWRQQCHKCRKNPIST